MGYTSTVWSACESFSLCGCINRANLQCTKEIRDGTYLTLCQNLQIAIFSKISNFAENYLFVKNKVFIRIVYVFCLSSTPDILYSFASNFLKKCKSAKKKIKNFVCLKSTPDMFRNPYIPFIFISEQLFKSTFQINSWHV